MRIDGYGFGWMKIKGKVYKKDLIIFPERIVDNWWRDEGHYLRESDIFEVFIEKPDVLVVGTGYYGYMKIDEELVKKLKDERIELVYDKTGEAVKKYNELIKNKRVVGVFHLTC
ncbi:MAG TPA: hypothetical protein ENL39_03665 [Candidatus Aerophobetes bacterium]|uniref:Uncharacterized protein n=1 Tax=Aerophobetes bacterium TaxID=2030807 RepID=A0A7V5HZ91_UNCAE|nr:hypothetical protein [Candidatus Aerophobetes bacterium]